MTIVRNPAAARLPTDGDQLSYDDVEGVISDAVEICSTEQDNDAETWYVTEAGQVLRCCGLDQDRFYVWEEAEAFDFLDGMAEEDALLKAWTQGEVEAFRNARIAPKI